MSASRSAQAVQGESPPTVTRLFDRVLGYDFFISYAHADLPGYAGQLHDQLRARGFNAFLDKQVYVAGDDLNTATLRRVRASSKLIVIVGPQALDSHWVLQEVEAAIDAQRPVIAIDLLGDLAGREDESALARRLRDIIHIREPDGMQTAAPSEEALVALARSFQATRREALRWRLALAGMLFLGALAVFSYWQKTLADEQKALANEQQALAEEQRTLAEEQKTLAEERADQYLKFCNSVVDMVRIGNDKINKLRNSEFGGLIADVTETLANLPDPDEDLNCKPTGS